MCIASKIFIKKYCKKESEEKRKKLLQSAIKSRAIFSPNENKLRLC